MIRQRVQRQDSEPHRDRWLISYADFITLLFGFFVVMYSVSQVNESKYKELSSTLASAFETVGSFSPETKDAGIELGNMSDDPTKSQDMQEAKNRRDITSITQLERQLDMLLQNFDGSIEHAISDDGESVEISLDAALLFTSGRATLGPDALRVFEDIVPILTAVSDVIEVAGHTDDQPISNQRFKNNWELSSTRAVSVVQALTNLGVAPTRLKAVGYGQYQPIADNATSEGRADNRRVVLKLSRTVQPGISIDGQDAVDVSRVSDNARDSLENFETRLPGTIDAELEPVTTPIITPVVTPKPLRNGGLIFTTDARLEKRVQTP